MNYKDIHDRIIEKAKKENRSKGGVNYYEAHHIVPRCMGGEGKYNEWNTHPNIILLTAKEHFVIHKLLCEIYPDNNKLIHAYWRLANLSNKEYKNYRIGSKEYERLKIKHAKIVSKLMSNRIVSEETKQKQRDKMTGKMIGENNPMFNKKWSEKSKKKVSEKNTGKKRTKDCTQKMSENTKGGKNPRARKVICNITGKIYECITDAA